MYKFRSLARWFVLSLTFSLLVLTGACSQDSSQNASLDETAEPQTTEQSDPLAAYDSSRIGHYGYGSPASEAQIAGWDIDIRPDGKGLPDGSGSVEDGEYLYEDKCAQCHGTFGEGEGRFPVLAGGQGSLEEARPTKTVGSYWPYTSTLYDYIYRAMPFTQPESLSPDETYALTAYVLYLNDLVGDDFVLNRETLADVQMPNAGNFVPDPRPDVANERCMENCRDPKAIVILSEAAPAVDETSDRASGSGEAGNSQANMEVTATPANHPGQETYQQYCSICHGSGVAGAPKVGDASSWTPRIEQGLETLVTNAISGISSNAGTMPPKGGFAQLSDEEVTKAVKYMAEASQ
ncbi:MAG: c-type cytochrome [Porticoccaceae bacterium]|nr:c-type cytochrome [Porticoccaceae bacterium]